MDIWFSCLDLYSELYSKQTYAVGTLQGIPEGVKKLELKVSVKKLHILFHKDLF
jgi:hypothetical protein